MGRAGALGRPDADPLDGRGYQSPIWLQGTRPVTASIEAAGFIIEDVEAMYLPKAPRAVGCCEWGLARPG
jgi:hypothetical protein